MPWTVAQLREYREYPQKDVVLQRSLELAEAQVDRINPALAVSEDNEEIARRDSAVEELVQIDLLPPQYSGNLDGGTLVKSKLDARSRILLGLVGAIHVVTDTRDPVFPRKYYA